MAMTITNSSQLLSQIAQNKGFRVSDDGQLKTQSSAAHFFSKIGDAIKGLTKAGQAAIIARNAAIENKMVDILRADEPAVPNLAANRINMTNVLNLAPMSNANLLKVMVPVLVKQTFEPSMQQAASKLIQMAVTKDGDGILSEPRDKLVRTIMAKANGLRENADRIPINFTYGYDAEECHAMGFDATLMNESNGEFIREMTITDDPSNPTSHFDDNIHNVFKKDADRRMCTIEGQFINGNAIESARAMTAGLDPKMTRFLTMMGCQAGIVGSMATALGQPNTVKDHPNMEPEAMLSRFGVGVKYANHLTDFHREGDTMYIRARVDDFLSVLNMENTTFTNFVGTRQTAIAGRHYEMEMVVDLTQDLSNKAVPDYTFTCTCTPISDADVAAFDAKVHGG